MIQISIPIPHTCKHLKWQLVNESGSHLVNKSSFSVIQRRCRWVCVLLLSPQTEALCWCWKLQSFCLDLEFHLVASFFHSSKLLHPHTGIYSTLKPSPSDMLCISRYISFMLILWYCSNFFSFSQPSISRKMFGLNPLTDKIAVLQRLDFLFSCSAKKFTFS